jgi:hypothetical protein
MQNKSRTLELHSQNNGSLKMAFFQSLSKHEYLCITTFHILVLLTASILIGTFCPGKLITGENVN